jgi:hypothetical protein
MVKGSIATRRKKRLLKLVPALALLAGLGLTAQHAAAATASYTVNTRTDSHNVGPGCRDAFGRCSLRAATEAADALPAGSVVTITVLSGHFLLNPAYGSLILNGNNTVTITGAGSALTTVDSAYGNCPGGPFPPLPGTGFSVFQNGTTTFPDPTDADNLTMTDLTIERGCADNGGGILNGGNLTLTRVQILGNIAVFNGGGVDNTNDFFPAIINDSTIDDNIAFSAGGGIYNDETLTLAGDHVDFNAVVTNSQAPVGTGGAEGGGLFTDDHVVASNSTFNYNQAADFLVFSGSRLKAAGLKSLSNIKSSQLPIDGRYSVGSKGGGIFVSDNQVQVTNSQIGYNQAGLGAGVYNLDRLTLSYDHVVSNQAGCSGGGTFNAAPLQVDTLTFVGPGQLYMSGDFVGTNSAGYAGEYCSYYLDLVLSGAAYEPRPFAGAGSYNDGTETITGAQYQRNYFAVPVGGGFASKFARPAVTDCAEYCDPSPCGFFVSQYGTLGTCGGGIYSGGAIVNPNNPNPAQNAQDFLTMVRLVGNQAAFGGGMFHEYGTANIQTSVFAANRASVLGGGIADFYNYGDPLCGVEAASGTAHTSLSSTYIQGNFAGTFAGGVYNLCPNQVLTNQGTIIGNYAPTCPNWLNGPTGISVSFPFGDPSTFTSGNCS